MVTSYYCFAKESKMPIILSLHFLVVFVLELFSFAYNSFHWQLVTMSVGIETTDKGFHPRQ